MLVMPCIYAQDNEKNKLKISGGAAARLTGYAAEGIDHGRPPLLWILSGNITFSFREFSAPFSFILSPQNKQFSYPQPFNQFGISPKYKFVTLHLGYRSMQFSQFTLAGNSFLGAGVEVSPQDFPVKIALLYGRFAKATNPEDLERSLGGLPTYERWGYGSKITLGNQDTFLDLILFKAKDNENSLEDSTAAKLNIRPGENLVLGTNFQAKISDKVRLKVEYGWSAYVDDIRNPEITLNRYSYANNFGDLYTPRSGTTFDGALQGEISYQGKTVQPRISYRRLGPNYRTMGTMFMNNDLEDITGGLSWKMLEGKLSFTSNLGVQRNNLDNNQLARQVRFIGALSANYAITNNLNAFGQYTNFNTSTQMTRFIENNPLGEIDSIFYLQVTNSANAGLNYNFGQNKMNKHTFMVNGNYQGANDNFGSQSIFYNIILSHNVLFSRSALSVNSSINYVNNIISDIHSASWGPSISLTKRLFDNKVRNTLIGTMLTHYQSGVATTFSMNLKGRAMYTMGKRHSLSLDLVFLKQEKRLEDGRQAIEEYRANLMYRFTFTN